MFEMDWTSKQFRWFAIALSVAACSVLVLILILKKECIGIEARVETASIGNALSNSGLEIGLSISAKPTWFQSDMCNTRLFVDRLPWFGGRYEIEAIDKNGCNIELDEFEIGSVILKHVKPRRLTSGEKIRGKIPVVLGNHIDELEKISKLRLRFPVSVEIGSCTNIVTREITTSWFELGQMKGDATH